MNARATYQDVLDAPPHQVAELIDGRLYLQPRPRIAHADVGAVLGMMIGAPFRLGRGGPGGWDILDEPELHVGDDVLVPDLAGWLRSEQGELDLTAAFETRPPVWVCEVLSPSTRRHDRIRKMPCYLAAGVQWIWLVSPEDQTVEVFQARGGAWTLVHALDDAKEHRLEPFEAVALDFSELWPARPGPGRVEGD